MDQEVCPDSSLSSSRSRSRIDQIAVTLSSICMVHCMLTPFLLLFVPFVGAFMNDKWFHITMVFVLLPLALVAFFSGVRQHGNQGVIVMGALGVVLISIGAFFPRLFWGFAYSGEVITIAGSLLLIIAHLKNRRLCLHLRHSHSDSVPCTLGH